MTRPKILNGEKAAERFLTLAKLAVLLGSVAVGSVGAYYGSYYSLKGMAEANRNDTERCLGLIQNHFDGFGHDAWFRDGRISHPTLRLVFVELHRKCSLEEHAKLETREDAARRWERLFDLNPELVGSRGE